MELLGELDLEERQLTYPSPKNPRLKGLTIEDPSIKALAESIKQHGLMNPILVQKLGDKYEVFDGDRRCVAVFKGLKRKMIRVRAYIMSELEATRLRLIVNIQRQDLTAQEKGSYCYELFRLITQSEGLIADEAWKSPAARSKYLAEICKDIGATTSTVINWIRLWETYPPEAQKYIARNKEDLRDGLIPPSVATEAGRVATMLNVDPMKMLDMVKHYIMTSNEINAIKRRISDGEDIKFGAIPKILKEFREEFVTRTVSFALDPYRRFLDKCKAKKMRFDDYLSLAIEFALEHRIEFDEYVMKIIKES